MARTSKAGAGRDSMGSKAPPDSAAQHVPQSFIELLMTCETSAVHLEMRDSYTPRDPDYLRWIAGHPFDPAERWPEWIETVRKVVDRGVEVRRARIISEPVTDYIRYEHALTSRLNIASGEHVRWLPREHASDLALPGNDFWVFDERLVLFNHFAGDGSSRKKEVREEAGVIRLCRTAFDAVWQRAIPHEQYRLT